VVEGRVKDLINRGGEKINAEEVETVLRRYRPVLDAAVVSMPDDRLGERACACVVLRPGTSLDFDTMCTRLDAAGLALFKRPERLEVMTALPTTASGKIQKHEILRRLEEREA